jgi:hypothetical protein
MGSDQHVLRLSEQLGTDCDHGTNNFKSICGKVTGDLSSGVGTLRVRIMDKAISTLQPEHEASTSTASSYFQGKLHGFSHFCVVPQELEIDMANRLDFNSRPSGSIANKQVKETLT